MIGIEDLTGLWTRSLYQAANGRKDVTTQVWWLQGPGGLYVDLRQPAGRPDFAGVHGLDDLDAGQLAWLAMQEGFAGRLVIEGDCFVWQRLIDFQPATALADAGRLWFEPGRMVEAGRDSPYIEHWHRDERSAPGGWAARLSRQSDGRAGLIVQVGDWFMRAIDRAAPLPPRVSLSDLVAGAADLTAARRLIDCELSIGRASEQDVTIKASTLPFREGQRFTVQKIADQLIITTGDQREHWQIQEKSENQGSSS